MRFLRGPRMAGVRRRLNRLPGWGLVRGCALFALDRRWRSEARLRRRGPTNLFQPFGDTAPDRYPMIFAAVAAGLAGVERPRLLSFGCSTGEEVFSLRRVMPAAHVTGVDVNPDSIRVCRRKAAGAPGLRFMVAQSVEAEPDESYDAVFAMAVFRHGDLARDRPARCDHLIRFAAFEETVAGLARCLKPGGQLAIANSHFRFADTAAAAGFDVVLRQPAWGGGPFYGPDDRLLAEDRYDAVLFRKR